VVVCQSSLPAQIMDSLSTAVASAKAAVEVYGSAVSGGKQCERIEVSSE